MKSALVIGGSGLVGSHCLEELLLLPQYGAVKALARRPLGREHPRLEQIEADFAELDAVAGRLGAEEVFCCLGTTMRKAGSRDAFRHVDFELPLRVAQAVRAQGASEFVLVSSLGADPASSSFYLRVKGELEEAVSRVGFESLIIMRPSLLRGRRAEWRWGEGMAKLVLGTISPLLRGSFRRYRPIRARTVARAMVNMANLGLYGRHIVESEAMAELAR